MPLLAPLWKGLRIALHLLTGAALAAVVATARALGHRVDWLDTLVPWWYRRLLNCLGVRMQSDGTAVGTALMVANHISWLDIPVIGAQDHVRFLSKAEVRDWPLIGWMSELAGTFFIARGANQVGEAIAGICERIQAGDPVAVFPEGTTGDGSQVQRFHPRIFAICRQGDLAVQPVALRYGTGPGPDPIAPFIGDDTLMAHLWRLIRQPGLEVRVSFLAPIPSAGLDRRHLADAARLAIVEHLGLDPADPVGRPGVAPRDKARAQARAVQDPG